MWIKIFEKNVSGSPLQERLIPADPPVIDDEIVLAPRIPMTGEIDLREGFPDIEDVLRRKEFVLFWRYAPEISGEDTQREYSGCLTIAKPQ